MKNTYNNKNEWKNIYQKGKVILLTICTLIASYGILKAPDSDAKQLEADLTQKQQWMDKQGSVSSTTASQDTVSYDTVTDTTASYATKSHDTEVCTTAIPTTETPATAAENTASATPFSKNKNCAANSNNRKNTANYKMASDSKSGSDKTIDASNNTALKKEHMVTVIGDSVFLGASIAFQKQCKNAVVDAKISRQVVQALDVAKQLDKKHKLGDIVIIALGTNGTFNSKSGQRLIDYLGTNRTIYWIDAYGKYLDIQSDVNKTIQRIVSANKNVQRIYWSKEGVKHPDWFYQDGTHLNPRGEKKYARFVLQKIKPALNASFISPDRPEP